MHNRSWLFVPGNSERKLLKAASAGADVVVLDLCGFDDGKGSADARRMVATWLATHRQQVTENRRLGRWVRINSLDSAYWREDLVASLPGAPDGIILPRATGPDAIRQLSAELYELEQANHLPNGSIRIIAVVGETPASALTISGFLEETLPRLAGFAWSAQELSVALGARRYSSPEDGWTDACRYVRAQILLAAHARGIQALDAFHADWNDQPGLKHAATNAHDDGFTGMIAIHPAQTQAINRAFTPGARDLEQEQALFDIDEEPDDDDSDGFGPRFEPQPELDQPHSPPAMKAGLGAERPQYGAILRPA